MSTELGVGYISLLPDGSKLPGLIGKAMSSAGSAGAKAFSAATGKNLGGVAKAFGAAGKDAGEALAKQALSAAKSDIAKLSKQMATATDAQANALGRLRVAQAKLTDVQNQAKPKASALAAAEEAVAAAQRKANSATDAAASVTKNLTAAQAKAKTAADDVAKAQANAGAQSTKAGGGAGSRFTQAFKSAFRPSEAASALNKIDGRSEGRALAVRFGGGFNGMFGGIVSKSAVLLAAAFATVGVGGLLQDSISLEATFSQTMSTMAAVAKVPAADMKNLSDLAIKMGADTTFSASEAGTAMLELAKGGLSAATIKAGGLEGTLTLAAAGGLSLADASTIASNALNTFQLKGSDMASVAAALAGGANASSASVESLGQALSQVGPGATIAGLTLQDTVGVLSSFDAAGIKGSDAGTSLKTMLTRLVPSTDKAAGAMKELGLKFTDANGEFVPITNVAEQLRQKLGKLSAEQQTTALSTIFGSDATRAATVLMNEGSSGIGKYIAATKDQNAANEVAAARMSGTAGAWESFKGSVETAKLQLGLFLAPAVQGGLKKMSGVVNGIVPAAKNLASAFQADVLPKLQQFGRFIRDEIVPSVQNLITAFTPLAKDVGGAAVDVFQKLGPALGTVGGVLADTVVPAIKSFTGFLADNQTLVGSVTVGIGAMVAAFYAWKLVLGAVSLAGKAYVAVQAALNFVMALNPIGIVVLALIGLAAGLVYAYKKSETFRNIVNGVFGGVRDFAVAAFKTIVGAPASVAKWLKSNWPLLLAVLTGPFGLAVLAIAKNWDSIKSAAQTALRFVVDKFLGFAQTILDTAAQAFGWVPGLGDKLKGASDAFGTFRDNVNRKLGGINDEPVDIKIGLAYTQALGQKTKQMKFAGGGKLHGPGTTTSDSIPIMGSRKEWMIKAKSSEKYGDYAMASVNAGTATIIPGFATGGRPGLALRNQFPSGGRLSALTGAASRDVDDVGVAIANSVGKQLAAQTASGGPSGPPGAVRGFRGKKLNERTIGMLLDAEKILGAAFHITQGSYSTSVAASGGTHAGGGVMDTDGPKGWNLAVNALRKVGFAAWHRTPAQGPWGHHIHSVARGDKSASASAQRQAADYARGGDGLGGGGMAAGGPILPKVLSFDKGGNLPVGYSVVHNGTGSPEPVGHDVLRKSDLNGMRIELDAAGVGTLTGYVRITAQDQINESNRALKRRVGR